MKLTDTPLVSVLMTVYNREKYIAEAIESVLTSSYTNFELLIVDDQSKDKSLEIARQYEATDSRIKVYLNEQNLGDYPNRNKAASYAKGKYLKYLDADDLIYWYGLEAMVEAMERFPEAAVGLSHSRPEELVPYPFMVLPKEAYAEHFLGRGLFNYGPTGMIIRRAVFEQLNGFISQAYIGDTEFLLRCGAQYPTVKLAPGLIWWRQHNEQQIVEEQKDHSNFAYRHLLNVNFIESETCPLDTDNKYKAIHRIKQHHARKILSLALKNRNFSFLFQAAKLSELSFFDLLKGFKSYE